MGRRPFEPNRQGVEILNRVVTHLARWKNKGRKPQYVCVTPYQLSLIVMTWPVSNPVGVVKDTISAAKRGELDLKGVKVKLAACLGLIA